MRIVSKKIFSIAFGVLCTVSTAQAQLLDTGLGNFTTSRSAGSGPAQRVSALSNTSVGSFGFYVNTTGAVDLKFMIWDAAGTNMLFEQVKTVNAVSQQLVLTDPLSFMMTGGQTYTFAIIGNGSYGVSAFLSPTAFSQNGLTVVNNNTNFGPYAAPVFQGEAAATIALQINGATTTVPEPGTYVLLASGLAALGLVARRRRVV